MGSLPSRLNNVNFPRNSGAGISTAAGLGDFRGKGGKWTEEDREVITLEEDDEDDLSPSPAKRARSGDTYNLLPLQLRLLLSSNALRRINRSEMS